MRIGPQIFHLSLTKSNTFCKQSLHFSVSCQAMDRAVRGLLPPAAILNIGIGWFLLQQKHEYPMNASVLFIHIQPLFLYICPQRLRIRIGSVPLVWIAACPHVGFGNVIDLQDPGQVCLCCRYDLLRPVALFPLFHCFRYRFPQNVPHGGLHPLFQLSVALRCQVHMICLRQFTASRIQKIHLLCHRQQSIFSCQCSRCLHTVFIKIRINHTLFDGNRRHNQDLRSVLPPAGNRFCLFHKDLHAFRDLLRIRIEFHFGIIGAQHQNHQV